MTPTINAIMVMSRGVASTRSEVARRIFLWRHLLPISSTVTITFLPLNHTFLELKQVAINRRRLNCVNVSQPENNTLKTEI